MVVVYAYATTTKPDSQGRDGSFMKLFRYINQPFAITKSIKHRMGLAKFCFNVHLSLGSNTDYASC